MAGRGKNRKVVRYRRPINIGVIFFGFIAIYLAVCVYTYFTSTHVSGYEVIKGSLTTDYSYTGIAVRTEEIVYATNTGYVNYYASENDKVGVLSTVYTIDETGEISELLEESSGNLVLEDDDYDEIRTETESFLDGYSDMSFSEVYDFKTSVNASILDLINQNLIDQLDSSDEDSLLFTRYNAETAGVVEYYIDGYEDITVEGLSADWFDTDGYEREELRSQNLVGEGDPVYKLVTEEDWQIVFPLDEEMEEYILEKLEANQTTDDDGTVTQGTTYIEIRFEDDDAEVWPSVTIEYVGGQAYGVLYFVNSMVRYADERYIDFEVVRDEETGLKIPKSAVTEKEFYIIDVEYVVESGDDTGFMKQTTDSDGNTSVEFVDCTIYRIDDDYAYVDPEEEDFSTSEKLLESGDLLVKTDSTEYYQVGQTAVLQGVYNINKGYTLFRQVIILYENEEYCIVDEGTSYGLSVYDQIVLNADTVTEEMIVY